MAYNRVESHATIEFMMDATLRSSHKRARSTDGPEWKNSNVPGGFHCQAGLLSIHASFKFVHAIPAAKAED